MSGTTTRLGLKTPADPDPFLTADFVNNLQTIDAHPGVTIATTGTLPTWTTAQAGMLVYCTDTRQIFVWTGTTWLEPLVAPSAWNLEVDSLNTLVSSGGSPTFSLGSFSTTRPGTFMVIAAVQYWSAAVEANVAADAYVSVDGIAIGYGYDGQANLWTNAAPSGWSGNGGVTQLMVLGVVNMPAGVHSMTFTFQWNAFDSRPGGTYTTTKVVGANALVLLTNTYNT